MLTPITTCVQSRIFMLDKPPRQVQCLISNIDEGHNPMNQGSHIQENRNEAMVLCLDPASPVQLAKDISKGPDQYTRAQYLVLWMPF